MNELGYMEWPKDDVDLNDERMRRYWTEFDRKYRRCEVHNLARYYCGCAYQDKENANGPDSRG